MNGAALGWDVTLAVALVALAGSAFFSGCETGYMSVSRARLQSRGALDRPRGRRLAGQLDRIEDSILTCLIGTNLFNVLGSAVVTYALASRYGPHGEWLALIIVSTYVIVGGEILPKVIYREYPESLMLASVSTATWARAMLAPVRLLMHGYTSLLSLALPPPAARGMGDRRSLAALLLSNAVPAADDRRFADLLERFVVLAGRSVASLARPLDALVTVSAFAPARECLAVAARSGHSRLAVRDGERIASYVLVRDLLLLPEEDGDRILPRHLARPLLMVDGRLSPYAVFEEMRGQSRQIALVCDPEGNPQGLVTLEDLIEAVVGAIADEFDPPEAAEAAEAGKDA